MSRLLPYAVVGLRVLSPILTSENRLLSRPAITVVGSYATGLTMKVDRLPHTGETLLGNGYRVDYGGKGSNQAVGCARLGAAVSFVAKIGKDAFADMALQLYRDEGVDVRNLQQTAAAPTGVGFIIVEASTGHNCIVLDPGANELLEPSDIERAAPAFSGAKVVLTQLEIPVPAAERALAVGRSQDAITILNPAPVRPLPRSVLELVDILTPNETEAKVLVGRKPNESIDPVQLARQLIELGVRQVVMTLGETGALIVSASSANPIPAIEVSPVDTTGAGDAFNAGLAVALAMGEDLESAGGFAVVTGGLAVTREGVIPSLPSLDEIVRWMQQRGRTPLPWIQEAVATQSKKSSNKISS
jgi:ribokinase